MNRIGNYSRGYDVKTLKPRWGRLYSLKLYTWADHALNQHGGEKRKWNNHPRPPRGNFPTA
jgi:hypothetical protein